MAELIGVLFILGLIALIIIGFITVLVWFVKLFSGSTPPPPPRPLSLRQPIRKNFCPGCGGEVQPEDVFCPICGKPQSPNDLPRELAAAGRVLRRLFDAGRIDEASFTRLWQAVEEERAQLAGSGKAGEWESGRVKDEVTAPVLVEAAKPTTPTTSDLPQAEAARIQTQAKPIEVAVPAASTRRSFTEMLAAFMEESSIRWGELVGGVLIIGCSLALVVSLWAEIAERPFLKFSVFMTLTAGLFGLGFYSAHRWKLPTTSRGVLLTATLLVPLNFLALAAFGRSTTLGVGAVLAESIAWLLLAALVWQGARVFVPEQQRWLTIGTLGAAFALLLAKHFTQPGLNWRSWLVLGALPVAIFVASLGAALRETRRAGELGKRAAYSLFTLLGVNLFAALLPFGLLLVRAGISTRAWRECTPLLALYGLPLLATGWLLWRRLRAAGLAGERTAAASLGLCGAALLGGSALLAIPLVEAMLLVALLNVVVFGWAAWRYELRVARFFALAQTIYVLLLMQHLVLGRLTWGMATAQQLVTAFFSTASAVLLAAIFAALIGAAEWWRGQADERQRELARDSEAAAWVVGFISLALTLVDGFDVAGDPQHVAWLYGFYALAAFALAWRRNAVRGSWIGLVLCLAACVQTCVFKLGWPQAWQHAWIVMWLVFATLAALLVLVAAWGNQKARALLAKPAWQAAWASALWASASMLARNEGLNAWYVWPLVLVGLACVVYAWRGGSETAACAGGLVFNCALTVGYVIWVKSSGVVVGSRELAHLAQGNLLTSAVYALSWGWAGRISAFPALLRWQAATVQVAWLGLLGLVAMRIIFEPWLPSAFVQAFGGVLGWVVLAVLWRLFGVFGLLPSGAQMSGKKEPRERGTPNSNLAVNHLAVNHLALAALSVGALAACTLSRLNLDGWLAYHTLLTTTAFGAWLMLWLLMLVQRGQQMTAKPYALFDPSKQTTALTTVWANGLVVLTTLLALRGYSAPGGPWRGVVALIMMAAVAFGLALARRNGRYCYAAGALGCTALTVWVFGYSRGGGTLLDVLMLNVTALALLALLSLLLELKWLRMAASAPAKSLIPAFHQFALSLLLSLMGVRVGLGLLRDFAGAAPLQLNGRIGTVALASVVALCVACLWDGWFAYRFVALFVAGFVSAGALVDWRNLHDNALAVWGAVVWTAYGLITALAWRKREAVALLLTGWRVPRLDWRGEAGLWWLPTANALVISGALLAAGWASVSAPQLSWRVAAASAALFAPFALGLVAHGAARLRWQMLTTVLAFLSVVMWCGAWLPPWARLLDQQLLPGLGTLVDPQRLVILLAWALGSALVFYCAEAARWRDWPVTLGAWEEAVRRVLRGLSVVGLATLGWVLFSEWLELTPAGVLSLAWWAKSLLVILLAALVVANVGFALWPGRAPFGWQGLQRGRFIYAAEVCALLLFAQVRMIAPWLFQGLFKAYWPVLVLALAFVGVGVSEQLQRRGRVVLAEPLARTGMFLPLLPSLGFWLLESRIDYAGLLLGVGLFYGLLSVMRQSFGFGLLAALAGNGGWWHWLHRTDDFGFAAHPQVWLIPAALSVMAAAHLNRAQLSQEQMTTIRYTALMTIYVSSTSDIFINGVADSPWLPLILAVLSVVGVMLGILLRVRAYLFLGTAFLLLAVITMVWHAALSLGWNWLYYVAGIAFGVLILYLLALFERKRAEVLGLVERLKTWQA